MPANRIDPTRTITLRKKMERDLTRRFSVIKRAIRDLLFSQDAFGLKKGAPNEASRLGRLQTANTVPDGNYNSGYNFCTSDSVVNTRWAFLSTDQQIKSFELWLQQQLNTQLLQNELWEQYVQDAYAKGQGRAFEDTMRGIKAAGQNQDFFNGTKSEFLRSAFGHPPSVEKVKILAGRVFTDLKGVTEAMATQLSRTLVDGLIRGDNPNVIARNLNQQVTKIGINRARTIARTEIIRAHAEGQLDAFDRLGVTELGVMAEWTTANDTRVCQLCDPLEGVVLTPQEARGLLPRHPNCRCAWVPANVGESTKGQVRGKRKVQKQIDQSISKEFPKIKTLKAKKKRTPWQGADVKIDTTRPDPITGKPTKKKVTKKKSAAPPAPKQTPPPAPTQPKNKPAHITKEGEVTPTANKVYKEMNKAGPADDFADHQHAIRTGKHVREEVEKHPDVVKHKAKIAKMQDQMDNLKGEINKLRDQLVVAEDNGDFGKVLRIQDKINALVDKRTNIELLRMQLINETYRVYNKAILEVLGGIREMGGVSAAEFITKTGLQMEGTAAQVAQFKKDLEQVLKRLPKDWIEEMINSGIIKKIQLGVDRGSFNEGLGIIRISGIGAQSNERTLHHELVHWVESALQKSGKIKGSMADHQRAFVRYRAAISKGEDATLVEFAPGEVGYKDEFVNHYIGRHYHDDVPHLEVMTAGGDSIMYGGVMDSRSIYSGSQVDNEFIDFWLGMYAGF